MVTVTVADHAEWRRAARQLLAQATPPEHVAWLTASEQVSLPFPRLEISESDDVAVDYRPLVPRSFQSLADVASCHRSPGKWDALYRLVAGRP